MGVNVFDFLLIELKEGRYQFHSSYKIPNNAIEWDGEYHAVFGGLYLFRRMRLHEIQSVWFLMAYPTS